MAEARSFSHRACYVSFAEHLQNSWNPNLYYPGAPNRWTDGDRGAFFRMLHAFGFNVFGYWLPPTLMNRAALSGHIPMSVDARAELAATQFSRILMEGKDG